MNKLQYRTSIYFSRKSKSREDLKKFDRFCKNDETVKKSYLGFSGRTFFFGFNTKVNLESFELEMRRMFEKNSVEYVFNSARDGKV